MVAAAPGRAGEVWVDLAGAGLWRSTDYGQNFRRIPFFQGTRPLNFAFGKEAPGRAKNEPALWVFGKHAQGAPGHNDFGLYYSTDLGATCQLVNRDIYGAQRERSFAADRQNFGRVFMGGSRIYFVQPNPTAPTIQTPAEVRVTGASGETTFTVNDAETEAPAVIVHVVGVSHSRLLPPGSVRVERDAENPAQWKLLLQTAGKGSGVVTLQVADGQYAGAKNAQQPVKVVVP